MTAAALAALAGRRAVVTGGAGFIGSHLVDALVTGGVEVRVLDDFSSGSRENLGHREGWVEVIEGDLRDGEACAAACRGVDVVFHQAALGSVPRSMAEPALAIDVNVGGTTMLLQAARDAGVGRVVYASSSAVYGDGEGLPKREGDEGAPLSPYALSKVVGERLAELFTRCYGMSCVGLRYFNVYGPRQDPAGPYAAVVPRWFAAIRAGEPPVIYGDGEQSRDFVFVADAVQANLLAAVAPAAACGRAYNVGGGRRTTLRELASLVCAAAGTTLAPVYEAERQGDILHSVADLEQVRAALAYAPATPLEDGLRQYHRHLAAGASR